MACRSAPARRLLLSSCRRRLGTRPFHGTTSARQNTDRLFRSGLADRRPRVPWIEAFRRQQQQQQQQQKGKTMALSRSRSSSSTSTSRSRSSQKPEERDTGPDEIQKMTYSYRRVVLPLGRDPSLTDTYINSSGHIRLGPILRDLDALAGAVAASHTGPGVTTATVALDRIAMAYPLTEICDLEYNGQVTHVSARSNSVEVTCQVARARHEAKPVEPKYDTHKDVLLTCTFTMVAVDPETTKRPGPTDTPRRLVYETPAPMPTPDEEVEEEEEEKEEERTFSAGQANVAPLLLAKETTLKKSLLGDSNSNSNSYGYAKEDATILNEPSEEIPRHDYNPHPHPAPDPDAKKTRIPVVYRTTRAKKVELVQFRTNAVLDTFISQSECAKFFKVSETAIRKRIKRASVFEFKGALLYIR
ncbi:hypothetical protein F5Y09DRAFT_346402 [Xylaria sp. FL1042]|nr:hypothetical protein F5Y09DRAFT_346402 [Xylaria sp. FL1042]